MRALLLATAAFGLSGTALADNGDYSHEAKTYRYGGTYKVTPAADIGSCATTCQMDDVCKAWSFQHATPGLGPARCELKFTIGQREENALMTSGISPRLSGTGVAPQVREATDDELLGASAATQLIRPAQATVIQTLPPVITSTNAKITVTSVSGPIITFNDYTLP